jgi:ABC-2 type transport system ATP-binding protein
LIEARGLSRSFGGRPAVLDVSFSVSPGEVVGFLGPNGAGKTTTMSMLLGLLRPGGGEVHIGGPVGYLPEAFAAYGAMSVRGYLRFMCRMKRADRGDADRAMVDARVTELAARPVARLSKGQRQRVGLAQARPRSKRRGHSFAGLPTPTAPRCCCQLMSSPRPRPFATGWW